MMIILKPNYNLSGRYYINKQILQFQNYTELISDDDIINLFMGLVRLIKRSAEMKIEAKYSREIEQLKDELKSIGKYWLSNINNLLNKLNANDKLCIICYNIRIGEFYEY